MTLAAGSMQVGEEDAGLASAASCFRRPLLADVEVDSSDAGKGTRGPVLGGGLELEKLRRSWRSFRQATQDASRLKSSSGLRDLWALPMAIGLAQSLATSARCGGAIMFPIEAVLFLIVLRLPRESLRADMAFVATLGLDTTLRILQPLPARSAECGPGVSSLLAQLVLLEFTGVRLVALAALWAYVSVIMPVALLGAEEAGGLCEASFVNMLFEGWVFIAVAAAAETRIAQACLESGRRSEAEKSLLETTSDGSCIVDARTSRFIDNSPKCSHLLQSILSRDGCLCDAAADEDRGRLQRLLMDAMSGTVGSTVVTLRLPYKAQDEAQCRSQDAKLLSCSSGGDRIHVSIHLLGEARPLATLVPEPFTPSEDNCEHDSGAGASGSGEVPQAIRVLVDGFDAGFQIIDACDYWSELLGPVSVGSKTFADYMEPSKFALLREWVQSHINNCVSGGWGPRTAMPPYGLVNLVSSSSGTSLQGVLMAIFPDPAIGMNDDDDQFLFTFSMEVPHLILGSNVNSARREPRLSPMAANRSKVENAIAAAAANGEKGRLCKQEVSSESRLPGAVPAANLSMSSARSSTNQNGLSQGARFGTGGACKSVSQKDADLDFPLAHEAIAEMESEESDDPVSAPSARSHGLADVSDKSSSKASSGLAASGLTTSSTSEKISL